MKATKFTEMSSLEWQEAYASVKNAIEESIKTCPIKDVSSYNDMDLDAYWNNLIAECWYEKDGEECHCDGFSIISQYILVEDEEDEEGLRDMFEQARTNAYESFLEELEKKVEGCECEDMTSQFVFDPDEWDNRLRFKIDGYEIVAGNDGFYNPDLDNLAIDMLEQRDVVFDKIAGYLGCVKADTEFGVLYFKKN